MSSTLFGNAFTQPSTGTEATHEAVLNEPVVSDGRVAAQDWPSIASSYELISRIGQGAFANVYYAVCRSGPNPLAIGGSTALQTADNKLSSSVAPVRSCAVKIINLENVDANFIDIRLEVQTMRLSQHPNILACYTNFVRDTELWLITQMMNRGSSLHCLQEARKTMKRKMIRDQQDGRGPTTPLDLRFENHISFILSETLRGLSYIHSNGQIHRDVKAGNILLDGKGNVRIADFGVSGWLVHGGSRRENTRTFVGTPCWMVRLSLTFVPFIAANVENSSPSRNALNLMIPSFITFLYSQAPEVMEQVHGYDYRADIWSLGITALELAKGYAPYAKFPPMKVLLLTIQEDPPSLNTYDDDDDDDDDDVGGCSDSDRNCGAAGWTKSFRSMVKRCLQKDPKSRPNTEDLLSDPHFSHLSDEAVRAAYKARMVEEACDVVGDVAEKSARKREKTVGDRVVKQHQEFAQEADKAPGKSQTAVCIVSRMEDENRPAGTTWIFSDGSQVMASGSLKRTADRADNSDDDNDFFDEFERQTQGENFVSQQQQPANDAPAAERLKSTEVERDGTCDAAEKSALDEFMDEFEKTVAGENFNRSE